MIANVGTTFSATSLAKFLKNEQRTVAPETILNYIKYCCEAYLFYQVKREDLQGKQILASNEKYYIADHGIREAVFGGNTRDINLILENIVYLELLRRGYEVTVGRMDNKEIDFVCNRRDEKLYVQVTYRYCSGVFLSKYSGYSVKYICWFFQAHQNKHAHALAEIIDTFETPKCHGLRLFPLIVSQKSFGFIISGRYSGIMQEQQMVLHIFLHSQE